MKEIKGFALLTLFTVAFSQLTFVFGFFFGGVKAFLSYFCMIGVSGPAVADASTRISSLSLFALAFFVYQKFFK